MNLDLRFPKLDDALVERLIPLAEELDDLASSGADCAHKIDQFNALAGTAFRDPNAFHYSGACSSRAFVRDALATTLVTEYSGLSDQDLLHLIGAIQQGDCADEASFCVQVLELNLPGAPISDLLFYPNEVVGLSCGALSADASPLDILRAARSPAPAEPIPQRESPGPAC